MTRRHDDLRPARAAAAPRFAVPAVLRRLVLLAAVFLALPAAALDVTLSTRNCGCDGDEGPRSKAEWEKADYRWLDDGRLEVQAWASEGGAYAIDERVVMADWRDGELVLSHGIRAIEVPPGGDVFACLFTVRLTYVVSGLARGAYRVHASPARTIAVEP